MEPGLRLESASIFSCCCFRFVKVTNLQKICLEDKTLSCLSNVFLVFFDPGAKKKKSIELLFNHLIKFFFQNLEPKIFLTRQCLTQKILESLNFRGQNTIVCLKNYYMYGGGGIDDNLQEFFLPCGFLDLNSDLKDWWQVFLPNEPYLWPSLEFLTGL